MNDETEVLISIDLATGEMLVTLQDQEPGEYYKLRQPALVEGK